MGTATMMRKALRLMLWGFDKRLHRARFATFDEIAALITHAPPAYSLLLGTNLLKHFYIVRSTKQRRELGNMLIVAPPRSGKSVLAITQLLTWEGSVIVNDIKGELFKATAGYRSTLGDVIVIDPTGYGQRYDPLHGKLTEDELFAQATRLLFHADEGEGAIFTQRATAMLTQLFLAARAENAPPLPYVRQIIRTGLKATAERLNAIDTEFATLFLDGSYKDADFINDRFLKSAWGTLTNRLRPILTERVIRTFAGSDVTPEEIMKGDRIVTVYLRWQEKNLLALSPLVRLLWGSLIDELITTYDKAEGRGCKPVLLLVDEAGRTAIPSLAEHATTVVGRGITLWLAIQSISQLEAVYGKARAQILRDNMETQIYYRPADVATADYLEHRAGRKSAYAHSQTIRLGAETSEGLSETGIPLVTAQTVMQMKDHDVLVFHRRLPPFKTRRVDWRNYTWLIKHQEIEAPTLTALPEIVALPFARSQNMLLNSNEYIDAEMILNGKSTTEITRREIN